jgi:hypothetical protein
MTGWIADTPHIAAHPTYRLILDTALSPLGVSWALPAVEAGVRDGTGLHDLARVRPVALGVFGGRVYLNEIVLVRLGSEASIDLVELAGGEALLAAGLSADRSTVDKLVARRPDLAGETVHELLDRLRSLQPTLRRCVARTVAEVAGLGGIVPLVDDPLGARLWDLSRHVRSVPSLSASVAGGDPERVDDDEVLAALGDLSEVDPTRGPSPWDIAAPSWGTDDREVLRSVAALAERSDDVGPPVHSRDSFGLATCRQIVEEGRRCVAELARRLVADGDLDAVDDLRLALDVELERCVTDVGAVAKLVADRRPIFDVIGQRAAPEVVDEPPLIDRWPVRA